MKNSHEARGASDGVPLVMMALVWGGTLNSSAAYLSTAVKGAASGTLNLRESKAGVSGQSRIKSSSRQPRRSIDRGDGASDPREGGRKR